MKRRIHIMGASGAGTSTLGRDLAEQLPHVHLDSDDYFWERKYTKPTNLSERLSRIRSDLEHQEPWILSGAVCGWGDALRSYFDLVIFLWIPRELRLERLKAREFARYGTNSLPGGNRFEEVQAFLEWASLYDTAGPEVRSLTLHEAWMRELQCPVLRLEGDLATDERVKAVLSYLSGGEEN